MLEVSLRAPRIHSVILPSDSEGCESFLEQPLLEGALGKECPQLEKAGGRRPASEGGPRHREVLVLER